MDDEHRGTVLAGDARGPVETTAAVALEAVVHQLRPAAATFFVIDDGALRRSIVHPEGTHALVAADVARSAADVDPLAPRALKTIRGGIATFEDVGGLDAVLAHGAPAGDVYRRVGAVDDVRLLLRNGDRVVGGIALWRALSTRWTPRQLAVVEALQPLVELAHVGALVVAGLERRLATLLPTHQREVALLIADGATNSEISRAMHIGLETVKSHTSSILPKLGARTRRDVMRRLAPFVAPTRQSPQQHAAAAERLFGAVMRWAHERIDGVAGGWAALSGRGAVVVDGVARADATVAAGPHDVARALHETLFEPAFVHGLRAAEGLPTVAAVPPHHPYAERIKTLAAAAGWTRPIMIFVRMHGRVAALAWLARSCRSRRSEQRAIADMRALQPLMEAAAAPLLRRALAHLNGTAGGPARALTAREWDVARRAATGATNAEIGRALGIAESTVKSYMTRVMLKCGVRSRTQLTALLTHRTAAGTSCTRDADR